MSFNDLFTILKNNMIKLEKLFYHLLVSMIANFIV